jgi:NADH dehydrogenase
MRHQTIALLGGTGFIGRDLVNRLVKDGRQVRIATRRRAHAAELSIFPVEIHEIDVYDPQQLAAFIAGADAVINLSGILHSRRGQPYGPDFARVHVELPKKIAAACLAQGVPRLLHMSALGAHTEGSSMYLRSKGDGELVVRSATGLQTTIFRPSVVFGPGDAFLNTFAGLQRNFPVIPLACSQARFQPVFVGDVSQAVIRALDLPASIGQIYELGGPHIYTLETLVRFAGQMVGQQRRIIKLPRWAGRLQARLFELLPGPPMLTRDNLDSMKHDSVLSAPLAAELGITPASLEAIAPEYLTDATSRGRFNVYRARAHR